ncbi:NAD(P)H-binding protein [Pseudonocardia sp.]|uniref:NmrA family NAD(P)-binding protein n=1 Tax=Pseudonocardia sp. TaxID=60912 RepID=UPI003D0A5AB2
MTILVTGATGNIGRMVVERLLAAGATDVRALTVDPGRAALPAGVQVVQGHQGRPDAVAAALDGVDRMYLAPDPATASAVTAAAARAGVGRIVDLSGEHESWWGAVTRAVEDSGVAWTHLWPGDFMENTRVWAPRIRADSTVTEPWPDAASAPVAMADVAAVAAAALLDDRHTGAALALTGPATLTRRDLCRLLGDALGREVRFVVGSRDETIEALAPAMGGDAAWYVDTVLAGAAAHPAPPTTTVADVTGRPATTFAQWATAHTDLFS